MKMRKEKRMKRMRSSVHIVQSSLALSSALGVDRLR